MSCLVYVFFLGVLFDIINRFWWIFHFCKQANGVEFKKWVDLRDCQAKHVIRASRCAVA